MRPWQHAKSSAGKARSWQDDLPVHEFLDSTKYACADRRHRVVLHNVDLGAEIAERVFLARHDLRAIVRTHVEEDLGHPASLADWWNFCDESKLPRPVRRRLSGGSSGIAELVGNRVPHDARGEIDRVCELLFLPVGFLVDCYASSIPPAERGLPILMNSVGPMIARHVFGPPRTIASSKVVVDYGWLAEAVIFTVYGRIPDLGEIVRCWNGEPTLVRTLAVAPTCAEENLS